MLCIHHQQALQELHAVDLKHLRNVETRLYCPQTFLIYICSAGMTFFK